MNFNSRLIILTIEQNNKPICLLPKFRGLTLFLNLCNVFLLILHPVYIVSYISMGLVLLVNI